MAKAEPFTELTEEQLCEYQKRAKTKQEFQRVQCLLFRQCGFSSTEIAPMVALNPTRVRFIWSEYMKYGESAIFGERRGGRYNENMTENEEKAFLEPFFFKANKGGILVVTELHKAYEKKLGRTVPSSTIYAMLQRHGWRKIAPRPSHPKGNSTIREVFKASFPPKSISGSTGGDRSKT
jgi:hypothetical protein